MIQSSLTQLSKQTVIGDSLIKYVSGYEVLKKLENCKAVVRNFLGSKDE